MDTILQQQQDKMLQNIQQKKVMKTKPVSNKIPILKMLNDGLDEETMDKLIQRYKAEGHYVDKDDLEKYKAIAPAIRQQKEQVSEMKNNQTASLEKTMLGKVGDKFLDVATNIVDKQADIKEKYLGKIKKVMPQGGGLESVDPALLEKLRENGAIDELEELANRQDYGSWGATAFVGFGAGVGAFVSTGLNLVGTPIMELYGESKKNFNKLPDYIKEPLTDVLAFGGEVGIKSSELLFPHFTYIAPTIELAVSNISKLQQEYPEEFEDLETVMDVAAVIPVGLIVSKGAKALSYGKALASQADELALRAMVIREASKDVAETAVKRKVVGEMIETGGEAALRHQPYIIVNDIATKTKNFFGGMADKAKSLKASITFNSAEKELVKQTLNRSPKPVATAVNINGLDISDARAFARLKPAELKVAEEMVDTFEKIVIGEPNLSITTIKEKVGAPFNDLLKFTDNIQNEVGKKLGGVIDSIQLAPNPNLKIKFIEKAQNLSGMKGLNITSKGNLDFSETSISKNTSAQNSINQYYDELGVRGGFGLHTLRQEVFEDLGGKSSAGIVLNETEDKVLSQMRSVIMKHIDDSFPNNPLYSKLSKEYAILENSMIALRRQLSKIDGLPAELKEKLIDLKLADLARRITSNAAADMSTIVTKLREVASIYGYSPAVDPLEMLNIYNILDRNLKFGQKMTSLQGEMGKALSMPTSMKNVAGMALGAVEGAIPAMKTPATIRRSFMQLIRELMGDDSAVLDMGAMVDDIMPKKPSGGGSAVKPAVADDVPLKKTVLPEKVTAKSDDLMIDPLIQEANKDLTDPTIPQTPLAPKNQVKPDVKTTSEPDIVPVASKRHNETITKKIKLIDEPKNEIEKQLAEFQYQTLSEMDVAEKGYRIFINNDYRDGVIGKPSSFPQWVPETLRRRKLFDAVLPYMGTDNLPTKADEIRLYNLINERFQDFYNNLIDDSIPQYLKIDHIPFGSSD